MSPLSVVLDSLLHFHAETSSMSLLLVKADVSPVLPGMKSTAKPASKKFVGSGVRATGAGDAVAAL